MTIMQSLDRRVNRRTVRSELRRLRDAQRESRQAERRYDGGLPQEQRSLDRIRSDRRKAAKAERRRLMVTRIGRRMDLTAILRQKREDGLPAWTIVDPASSHAHEGRFDTDGMIMVSGNWRTIEGLAEQDRPRQAFEPAGIPALPPKIRKLATDRGVRRRAKWVGVLYQPDEWREVDPDPALVVEWKDAPGEYYALAVWGVDGPRIMEFVD